MTLFKPFNITDKDACVLIGTGFLFYSRGLDELYGTRNEHAVLFVFGIIMNLYSIFY